MGPSKKRGRPRKKVDKPGNSIMRQYWREKSSKYYKRHSAEVLARARRDPVKCTDCELMTFDETGPYMYECKTVSKIHTDPKRLRKCSRYEPRRRDMK